MTVMLRLVLICTVMLAGTTVGAQSSAAVSAARGAASAASAPAGEARTPRQSPSPAARPPAQAPASEDSKGKPPAQGNPAAAAAPVIAATAASQQAPAPTGFTYNPEGRRDPFVSLADRGADTRAGTGPRPAGLAGLGASEVTLRGTLRSRDGFVAMLQGSDQKTYIVRPGDKLFDGTVSTISQNDLVILQQVNDPLSIEKQREVRKGLRQAEAN
jgi:Tfp pilus assembly protein PilP